jgi:uncharacterized protein YndB with AHSA1/START domain
VIEASRDLLASRADVWALVSEPYHLPDWWPAYNGVQPDRRGLTTNARWEVVGSRTPGFLRRPRGSGLIVITEVARGRMLRWHDVAQGIDAGIRLDDVDPGRTRATAFVDGPFWRLFAEGARGLPQQAVARLYDLCQTASSL